MTSAGGRLLDRSLREVLASVWLARGVVLLLALVLLFGEVADEALASTDTALHGGMARRMAAGAPWLVPELHGVPWFEHFPPFLWLAALSFELFGFSSWAGRLPGLLLALVAVMATFEIARAEGASAFGAMWAGVALAASELFWRHAARIRPDMLLVASIAVAVLALYRRRYVVFGLATGLALFAKGPMGVVPLVVLAAMVAREPARLRERALWIGLLLVPLVPLPWIAYQLAHHTGWYERYVLHQVVTLPLEGDGGGREPLFPLRFLATTYWPWLPFMLLAIARRRLRALVPLVWAGFVVAVVAASAKHPDYYLLPAYPAFALLSARALEDLLARWAPEATLGVAGVALLIALVLAITPLSPRRSNLELESRSFELLAPAVRAAAAERKRKVGVYALHENRAAWCLELYTDLPEPPASVDDASLYTFTSTSGRLLILPAGYVPQLPGSVASRVRVRAEAGGLALLETR